MKYRVLIVLLIINVIIFGIGGYFYWQNQNSLSYLKTRTESMYQQSFHSLVSHIKTIEDNLAKSLVAKDLVNQQEIMSTITRQVYSSQEELGKLPLILVDLVSTETTLQKLGDFAWQVNTKNLEQGNTLTDAEWKTLVNLKKCTSEILSNLQKLQSNIIENNLSWVNIELMYNKNEVADNTVIDGLHLVDKDVKAYSETQAGIMPHVKAPKIYYVSNTQIDEATAKIKATEYLRKLNLEVGEPLQVITSEGDIPSYVIFYNNGVNQYTCAVTRSEGRLVWLMGDSILKGKPINDEQSMLLAKEFLTKMQFEDTAVVGHTANENAIMIMFAGLKDDIILYPEIVRFNINLNNGIISGVDFSDYIKYHHERTFEGELIDEQQLKQYLPKNVTINNIQKAIIFNQQGMEVLTYEVAVSIAGENYLIYINAQNGSEENIIRIENKA